MAIYVGTVGLRLNFTFTGVDISAPGVFQVRIHRPDGEVVIVTPTLDSGPSGTSHYDTVAGDLPRAGTYTLSPIWWPSGLGGNPSYGSSQTLTVVAPW